MKKKTLNIFACDETALKLLRVWSEAHAITLEEFHSRRTTSAARFPARCLRSVGAGYQCAERESEAATVIERLGSTSEALAVDRLWACATKEHPFHLAVPSTAGKRATQHVRFHSLPQYLPKSAYVQFCDGVMIASPELLFVQMAQRYELGGLIALGYELCGSYPLSASSRHVRAPLTSPELLKSFIQRANGLDGISKARRALRFVCPKSASIMETEVSVLASTSVKWGGFGLPAARLNERVKLSPRAATIARIPLLTLDAFWPDAAVALEYEGREAHGDEKQRIQDSRRRDALSIDGIEMLSLTFPQFATYAEFEAIMDRVRRRLGKKQRPKPATFLERNSELRRQVRRFHLDAD